MYEITDLSKATGFTVNQVRIRLELLSPILSDGFHRGPRDKILVKDSVLVALRRMYEVERDQGVSAKEAQGEVARELRNGDGNGESTFIEGDRRLIEVLERENRHLRDDVAWLRGKFDTITPALSGPRQTGFRLFGWILARSSDKT